MMSEDDTHKIGGDQMSINTGGGDYVDTGGGDYAGRDIDKRQGVFIYYQPATTPLDRQQQRNRRAMLAKVKTIWIEGLLEQSLAKELRMALNLTDQPDAVDLPLNALVQELRRPPRELPAGTPIIQVFEQMGGALLILGAPGAGKTTLLLELARDLIARAEQDEGHPIPVVFNLSTWATNPRLLKEWLVEDLNLRYDIPRKVAQEWVDTDAVLPLLDGLDEVAEEHRSACVTAINEYRQQHSMSPLAVCSRVADYEALATKLRLQGAVVVQPLTRQQVDDFLERSGEKLVGVRSALHDDTELGQMLDTPLMLSIVALAYAEKSAVAVLAAGTPDERRRHLFDAYIEAMFRRRSKDTRYRREQTTRWLSWLAGQMVRHNLTAFYIERMQLSWLPRKGRRWFAIRAGLLGALVGGLVVAVVGGLVGGLVGMLVVALLGVLGGGLVGMLGGGLVGGLGGGLAAGLTVGEDNGLAAGLSFGLVAGLVAGPIFGLLYGGATVLQHYTLCWMLSRNDSLPLRLVPFLDYCAERIFLRKVGGGYIFVHRLLMEHFASLHDRPSTEHTG